jgi:CopG family transcriptional regulator, nickel-responsive regulator
MSNKDALTRFGVSMPEELVARFDLLITGQGYDNRSEAIRDLIRKALIEPSQMAVSQTVAGTIVMVYDHHASELPITLMELQHDYHHDIISTMHIHLNHDQCLEILVVRGQIQRLRELTNLIHIQKGVSYAELSVTYIDNPESVSDHRGHRHA